ncbi:MAG TPA: TolC family protein [Elusimicrobiales bacterium]|nr:TolC family protein [Elusimicrobiales bacterium]
MKILIYLLMSLTVPARAAEFAVSLAEAERGALEVSGDHRSAGLYARAAEAAAEASGSALYPRLALEGNLRYAAEVPEISMPTGARPLGDNWNYTIGPSAYWTLDGGSLRHAREAARRNAASRSASAEAARRGALLRARTAYFRLQLALEKVYLIGESLALSESQLKDTELAVKAGSRSRLDGIRARQETLDRRREMIRARSELAGTLSALSLASGIEAPRSEELPLDARLSGRDYAAGAPLVKAENYDELLARLMPASKGGPGLPPSVRALDESAAAALASARSYKAEKLPRLVFSARTSLDYPNGPNLYSFIQGSAGLALNMPLFESGRLDDRERESRLTAEAASALRDEAARSASRDYYLALDEYRALLDEQAVNIEAAEEAGEAAGLAYAAYKSGGATWLEVESANLRALRARTDLASVNAGVLIKLAVLDSLK